jgi:NAD(P)-dependent dehydrogenase (short-subunit alcohol dehydrogenase family)
MSKKLEGKVAVVTGASKGKRAALCDRFTVAQRFQ